jgi:predicted amidohydrolase YtcJ
LAAAVHAIGDRANMEVLDVFEQVRREQPESDAIMRIEHAQVLRREDIPRFAALGVVASMQPIHVVSDMDVATAFWGPRARNAYLWKTLKQSGARVTFGSDAPIEDPDPLRGIHAAVTRRRPGSPDSAAWNGDECLSVAEALDGYTAGGAAASGSRLAGRLEPGFRADLTVLDLNILAADSPDAILDTGVAMTVIGGEIHYEA